MKNGLRSVIESARDEAGGSLKDYTVLSPQIDPYRLDTPAMHEVGKWFVDQMDRLDLIDRRLHLRDIHYALLGSTELLSGKPLVSSAWPWTNQTKALKARKAYKNGPAE